MNADPGCERDPEHCSANSNRIVKSNVEIYALKMNALMHFPMETTATATTVRNCIVFVHLLFFFFFSETKRTFTGGTPFFASDIGCGSGIRRIDNMFFFTFYLNRRSRAKQVMKYEMVTKRAKERGSKDKKMWAWRTELNTLIICIKKYCWN